MNEQATSRPDDPWRASGSMEVLLTAEVFDGEQGCIAQARALADRFLARLVAEWLAVLGEHTRSDLMLAVSELVTNADRYSHGPYLLELEGTAERISVTLPRTARGRRAPAPRRGSAPGPSAGRRARTAG
ncbi:hypothetical protein ACWEF9_21705, partial [Streptomyces sp. NPDC004980]